LYFNEGRQISLETSSRKSFTEDNEGNEAEGARLFFSFVPFVSFCEVLGLYFNEGRQISLEMSSRKSFYRR
jgi:hypothetical protein